MLLTGASKWRVVGAALGLLGASFTAHVAEADANGSGIAAAIGLTSADGSVRTTAGVRLSIQPAAGGPDRVYAMSDSVQARMPAVRECFAQAMLRSPTTEGHAEFEVEAGSHGNAHVKLTRDDTQDPSMVSCMKKSLGRASFKGIPRGSRALVAFYLSNPVAALRKRMDKQATAPSSANVRMVSGRAESEGGTQAGDITFKLSGTPQAAKTIAGLQHGMTTDLAGLLDCRRKAFRHERASAHGQVEVDVKVRDGAVGHGAAHSTLQRAPQCVEQWLGRLDGSRLADADVRVAINFKQP